MRMPIKIRPDDEWVEWTFETIPPNQTGDFVELGVFRGDSFRPMIRHAKRWGVKAWGFDSMQGMAPPTEKDGRAYPAGRLSIGGEQWLVDSLTAHGFSAGDYELVSGYVPAILKNRTLPPVSFVHVDLDQYAPTLHALRWVWPFVVNGGLVVCDDYFPRRLQYASAAVDDFLHEHKNTFEIAQTPRGRWHKLWVRKKGTE